MIPVQLPSRPPCKPGVTSLPGEAIRDQQIEPGEYVELVLSNRPLLRDDDRQRQLLRLLDPVTGVRYVIPERQLFDC